ncbi:MAG: hypothetical protein R3D81_07440 [Thalassovita sp.]
MRLTTVPQRRERVFIVGVKDGACAFNHPSPLRDKNSWITSQQAIADLESLEQDESFSHIWSHAKKSSDQGDAALILAKHRTPSAPNATETIVPC